jgi:hypothetical protein
MVTLNPFKTLLCHECKQGIQNKEIRPRNLHNNVNEGRDDEEEFVFHGIPIAGENKGDSEEDWYYSDESEQEEDVLHQNFTSVSINTHATEDIAFLVGPTQDGRVKLSTRTPIPFHLNPYQLLDEEYIFPTPFTTANNTPRKPTWSATRADELQRLASRHAFTAVTNAQRLAQPWKLRKQQENTQRKKQHAITINL